MNSAVWVFIRLLCVGLVLLFGGVLYYHVSTKETLEFRSRLIDMFLEHKLASVFSGAKVSMQDVRITWRRADENFFLCAADVRMVDKNMGIEVLVPEVSVYSKIGILFLWGDWGNSRLEVPKISVDFKHPELPRKAATARLPFTANTLREKMLMLVRSDVPVKIGELLLRDSSGDSIIVDHLRFGAENEYDGRVFNLELVSGGSAMKAKLSEHYKGVVSLHLKYSNFDTKLLKYFSVFDERFARYQYLKASGTADIVLDAHSNVEYGSINVHSLEGVFPYLHDEEIVVDKFKMRAKYSDGKLQVSGFDLWADDMAIKAGANFDAATKYLTLNLAGYEVESKKVCAYWPKDMYEQARTWYCENVLSGSFREPQVAYHGLIYDMGNLANYIVSSHLKDAVVAIEDELGAVNVVDGGLLISKGDLVIRSGNYSYRGIRAQEGVAMIKGIQKDDAKLEVHGRSHADAAKLYNEVGGDDFFGLGGENVAGKADTKFSIVVKNLHGEEKATATVSLTSDVQDFSVEKVLGAFHLQNTSMQVEYEGGDVKVDGKGEMNGQSMFFNADIAGDENAGVRCKFEGYVSGDDLQRLSVVAEGFDIKGQARTIIDCTLDYHTGQLAVTGMSDIRGLYMGVAQESDEELTERMLTFSAIKESDSDIFVVNDLRVQGNDTDVHLHGKIGESAVELISEKLHFAETDAAINVNLANDVLAASIEGKFLDLSKINLGGLVHRMSSVESSNVKKANVSVKAAQALMNNGVLVDNADFAFVINEKGETDIKVRGDFSGSNKGVSIDYGAMGLAVETGNAGKFLRAIDVLSTVDGGTLSLYLYPEQHPGETRGMFSISRFNVVGAPILAQILTLSSLKGISNTLSGSGIHFSKLNVPFNYSNDVIHFEETWMEGVELGISLGGKIDLKAKNFDVRGQIVPAYAVNKMVWNTPMIGKLLTGGGLSRGIVAIDYQVKGTSKVHDISVNFLSILAPNLLKRVLKVLDYKTKQEATAQVSDPVTEKVA